MTEEFTEGQETDLHTVKQLEKDNEAQAQN